MLAAPIDSSGPALESLRFHTAALSDEDRFESWRERVVGLYEVLPSPEAGVAPFHMDTTSWHLGQLIAGTAHFGPRDQRRSLRQIRIDHVDHYRLILQTSGSLRIDADGREAIVGAGQIIVTDMSRPEFYSADEGTNISLFLPRDLLNEAVRRPLDLHGLVPRGATASMLADHLSALIGHLPRLTKEEAALLTPSTVSLIAACLLPNARTLDQAKATLETTQSRQACRYIDEHLGDPELSPQQLCAALKISRATLYRLFEPLGGVAAYVRERRLTQIHKLLEEPGQRRPLARIAEDHGFNDAAHFSRAFRQQFGYSPSDVEQRRGAAAPAPIELSARPAGGFDGWLRALR